MRNPWRALKGFASPFGSMGEVLAPWIIAVASTVALISKSPTSPKPTVVAADGGGIVI